MKNTIRKIKNMKYTKLVIGIIIGVIIAGTSVYYAATIYYDSVNVGYDNSTSGLAAGNVQDALDELCTTADMSDRVSAIEDKINTNYYTRYLFIHGSPNGLSDPATINAIKTEYNNLSQGTYIGSISCGAMYGIMMMKASNSYGVIFIISYTSSTTSGNIKVMNIFNGTWSPLINLHS